jgi:hypothetical protein
VAPDDGMSEDQRTRWEDNDESSERGKCKLEQPLNHTSERGRAEKNEGDNVKERTSSGTHLPHAWKGMD